jgi:hypothetical protein
MTMRPAMLFLATVPFAMAVSVRVSGQDRPGPQRRPATLPEGPGRDVVHSACVQCHGLDLIIGSGHTREGWKAAMATMVALPGDRSELAADYLAKHFPDKPRPPAVVIPGRVAVSITEWDVPSLGSRPHDPLGPPTAPCGGRASGRTCSDGSTRQPGP